MLRPVTCRSPAKRSTAVAGRVHGQGPAGQPAAQARLRGLQAGHVEPDVLEVGAQRGELDDLLEDLAPLVEEPAVAVVPGLVAGRLAHPRDQLGGGEHLDDPVGHRPDATGRHQEAVDPSVICSRGPYLMS